MVIGSNPTAMNPPSATLVQAPPRRQLQAEFNGPAANRLVQTKLGREQLSFVVTSELQSGLSQPVNRGRGPLAVLT